ncbi:hypothetical protein Dda_3447 [Drechslerella dactyloides]|uniref:Uncharacterized protein n=1 Tax=Drechslerella dactyloides TaxID=74499 RepID=A0AAD6J3N3_DREDA|nr:hypothetical protein Dda_3447 [Drechslerella dactyloides]
MSTPTPQSQLQFPVKLVASKLAKDSWPSWYKADARDDESDSSGWRYHLEYQDRKSSFWVIRDPFAGAADAEGDLRWLLEDHAVKNPYWLKKASAVNEAIQEYGKTLYNQIRRPLEYVILGDSRLQRPRDILQGISICLLITGENSDHTIHALHWEALELQLDLDINIVRTVYPLTAQSEGVRGTTESINRHGVTASLGVPVGLVGEDEKMDIDTGDSNNEALLTDDRESESSSYSSTNANPPEFLPVGEVSTLRILFCTARSAAIPNADIEYRVIARTVHNNIIWQNEGDWLSDETVDMAFNLVALNSESKKTLSDILHDQEFFYVVLVTDMRSDCTIATELLWNTLPEAAQATPQSSDHTWKLDMCAWLLDYNPAAIKLLFGDLETGIQDDSSLTTMLDSLLMTGTPEHTKRSLIRLYESRFMKRVVAIWEEVASDSRIAGLLFLCLGCSTLRIRQDPKYLVKAFLSSHLIADWRKPIDLDFDITNIELGAEILSQLQELSNMRMYGDLLSHCRAYYTSILIRLESEGLIWRAGEDYFQVHPLLRPCALPICLIDSGPESYQELTKIFREQYQMASEDWELGDLLVLWSAKSSVDVPRDSPRYMLSTDLGNCLNVLCQPLLNSGSDSQWLRGFPWMLFIHTIIYLCASIDSRDVQSIDIFVEALATTFLRKWNLSKLEWPEVLERLQDPGSDEHDFLASNPLLDPRIGPFTAALVPLLRMKRYLSTDAITQILAGEATELYNELMSSTSKPNFDEDPMMVELLRGKFFIVGYNTGVEATRLEYLNTQFHRMQENLKKHFSSGVFSKLSNAYRAGVTKGIEKICRKLQSPLPVTGLTTVAECSAWALERGLELNIEEGIREPMPQELDGLAFPIIGLDEPQFDQMDAISGFPPSENQELERIGKETTASQDNQMVHWLIYYAHQSLRADNLGEAATAFQKARLHLMKIHPQIFDKSLSMTVERSNAFSSFFLESTALWGLGKRTEGRGLLLEMRDLCGGHLNCALDRHELWDKYRSMDLLFDEFGAGKDAEAPRYLERIEWAIEFISIHFEHTEEVENSVSDFLRNAHNLNRRARSDEITKPRDASERVEHRIFSFLFGQHSRGLVSTYSTHLGQQSRQFLRTVFDRIEEMVGVKRVDVARLLERVQSLHDSTRSYWQEGGKVSPHIAEIYVEAAKVLFGNLEDCRGFVHLTESEGKPLRKYFPWEKPEINPAGGALKHPEFDLNCLAGALGTQGGFNFNQSTEEDDNAKNYVDSVLTQK